MKNKVDLWHGRLKKQLNKSTVDYLNCINDDVRLFEIDINVIKTHCKMLNRQKYMSGRNLHKIISVLEKLRNDYNSGKINILNLAKKYSFTDIHPIIEKYVIDACGMDIGGITNLGKSRNDQVMTDVRIYLAIETKIISAVLLNLIRTLLITAEKHIDTILPGYTHMQPGQATTFAHYLLSHADIFLRSYTKLQETYTRINLNPLGACAIAGTTINIDRNYTTVLLGFDALAENSMDAVSSRDFILELASELAIIMTALSRMAEDLIIWSTPEFGFIELADELCDTSTAMPQKKNPSTMELLRGKTATVIGALTELFTIIKGLPTGYNQDLQQMKPAIWRIIDIIKPSIELVSLALSTAKTNRNNMLNSAELNFTTAIDLAEYLTEKQYLSFRQSHFLTGELVKNMASKKSNFANYNIDGIQSLIKGLGKKLFNKTINIPANELAKVLNPATSILRKKGAGSPAPAQVRRMLYTRLKNINEILQKR